MSTGRDVPKGHITPAIIYRYLSFPRKRESAVKIGCRIKSGMTYLTCLIAGVITCFVAKAIIDCETRGVNQDRKHAARNFLRHPLGVTIITG
jgi:hypothetical protein